MNINLPAILMFTRGTRFWHTAIYEGFLSHVGVRKKSSSISRWDFPWNSQHPAYFLDPPWLWKPPKKSKSWTQPIVWTLRFFNGILGFFFAGSVVRMEMSEDCFCIIRVHHIGLDVWMIHMVYIYIYIRIHIYNIKIFNTHESNPL